MRKIAYVVAACGVLLGSIGAGVAAAAPGLAPEGITAKTTPGLGPGPELSPESIDFGKVLVGSGPAENISFLLYAGCAEAAPPPSTACATPDELITSPSTTGDFVLVSTTCPEVLVGPAFANLRKETCGLIVGFNPTAAGLRTGTLSAGGLTSTLTGTGLLKSELFPDLPPREPPAPAPAPTQPTTPGPTSKPSKGKAKGRQCKKKGKGEKAKGRKGKGKKAKGSAVASRAGRKGKHGKAGHGKKGKKRGCGKKR